MKSIDFTMVVLTVDARDLSIDCDGVRENEEWARNGDLLGPPAITK